MTKRELLKEYAEGCREAGISHLDGIGANSNKKDLQNAIDCLSCHNFTMEYYFEIVARHYPNTCRAVSTVGYLRHPFNRLYVFNTARYLLAGI